MTYDELKERVEANNNVLSVRMEELREIEGVRRLGVHVCDRIAEKLSSVGLGHMPNLVPDGWQEVRLFRLGTPVADLIGAVRTPGADNDNRLREFSGGEAVDLVEKIRALVCN
jgi:hypothetical protein